MILSVNNNFLLKIDIVVIIYIFVIILFLLRDRRFYEEVELWGVMCDILLL